jgi:glycosyltransferase involved in cell wall biosynthesis
MKPVRILVESLADSDQTNSQMVNAREIIRRLDPDRFHVSTFRLGVPDQHLAQRPNTRLIPLPSRRQTARILPELLFGPQQILFYVKASPAARWYMMWRSKWKDRRITIGTIESQSNWRQEPTIAADNIALIEQTVLRCDYLFSNSAQVKSSLHLEYGLRSEIVPTGVDTDFFTPAWERAANPRPRILFVGSLRPFKGPQTVIDAAQRFPQFDFTLVGSGVLADELKARAKHLPNVELRGSISRTAVREEYRQADIFLFPSRWEGFPKVILEAAACGLPVIARKDYRPESVLHEQTGYLVGHDDELFARVADLGASPELRRTMGRAGRAHVEQFDWDHITKQWEEIFLRLLPGTNGRGH